MVTNLVRVRETLPFTLSQINVICISLAGGTKLHDEREGNYPPLKVSKEESKCEEMQRKWNAVDVRLCLSCGLGREGQFQGQRWI